MATGNIKLQQLAKLALEISPYDFSIIRCWSGEDVQNALYDQDSSTLRWPDSKHNVMTDGRPDSEALDFGPFIPGIGIPWKDTHIFAVIAGCFFAAANTLGYRIRWGGDWDSDGSTKDQTLMDYGHVEIIL